MPQLLAQLEVETAIGDSVDWGVLAVYVCSASCDVGAEYADEFVFSNTVAASTQDSDDDSDEDSDED